MKDGLSKQEETRQDSIEAGCFHMAQCGPLFSGNVDFRPNLRFEQDYLLRRMFSVFVLEHDQVQMLEARQ